MPVTHYLEEHWRKFRRTAADVLEELETAARKTLSESGTDGNIEPIPSLQMSLEYVHDRFRTLDEDEKTLIAMQISMFSAYRQHKRIYVVQDRLSDVLKFTRFNEDVPSEALILPVNGMVICGDIPHHPNCCAVLFHDASRISHRHFLDGFNIAIIDKSGWLRYFNSFRTDQDHIAAILEELPNEGITVEHHDSTHLTQDSHEELRVHRQILRYILTCILYIINDKDVVAAIHPGTKPEKLTNTPGRQRRLLDAREPDIYNVGDNYVRTLEHYEADQRSGEKAAVERGRSVKPHIRGAHTQVYWTGKGRTIPKVRFKLPVPVKGGKRPGDFDEPTIIWTQ